MVLRLLSSGDLSDLMELKIAANWNQTAEDWLRILRLEPAGCFGIESEEKIVASASVISYGCDLAWIGMVLTAPAYRGRGLARKLMQTAIEYCGHRAIKLDASDMGRSLYESLGFVEECAVERWVRQPGSLTGLHLPAARIPSDFDTSVFGADRSSLLRELSQELPGCDTAETGNRSYAFSRPGSNYHYFGPCVAESAREGRRLFEWCLGRHGHRATCVDLFPDQEQAARIAAEFGFVPARRLTRMVMRPRHPELPDPRVYAIAGFEFG
jgi:GNAT superfamily N-acetyltransferase